VTNSSTYEVIRREKFEVTFERLCKSHYRKDKKSKESFVSLVNSFLESLKTQPRPPEALQEPIPARNCLPEGCEFRKMKWRSLPGLRGSAKYGRLLYMIFEDQKLVYPFWIYTHAEFGKPKSRPPAKEILKEIKDAVNFSKGITSYSPP
jgi:hypothetical protein